MTEDQRDVVEAGPCAPTLIPNGLRVSKYAREAGRPWLTPQACLDKHRCGHGRMAMQGLQSLHRAEAMTRSLARPNSRLQCQQISIRSFRSHSLGVRGRQPCPKGDNRVAASGYLRRARQPGCLTPRSRSRIPPAEIPHEDHASYCYVFGDNCAWSARGQRYRRRHVPSRYRWISSGCTCATRRAAWVVTCGARHRVMTCRPGARLALGPACGPSIRKARPSSTSPTSSALSTSTVVHR